MIVRVTLIYLSLVVYIVGDKVDCTSAAQRSLQSSGERHKPQTLKGETGVLSPGNGTKSASF